MRNLLDKPSVAQSLDMRLTGSLHPRSYSRFTHPREQLQARRQRDCAPGIARGLNLHRRYVTRIVALAFDNRPVSCFAAKRCLTPYTEERHVLSTTSQSPTYSRSRPRACSPLRDSLRIR